MLKIFGHDYKPKSRFHFMAISPSSTKRLMRRLIERQDYLQRLIQTYGLRALAGLALRVLKEQPSIPPYELADWQRKTFKAIQDRLCDYSGLELPSTSQINALQVSLDFLANMPDNTRQMLSELLMVIEASPRLLSPFRSSYRYSALPQSDQAAILEFMDTSSIPPVRGAFQALKSICMMGYWSQPQTWGYIGYSLHQNPGIPPHKLIHIPPDAVSKRDDFCDG